MTDQAYPRPRRGSKRDTAEVMRAEGASYQEITAKLGVSKSTLSYWFTGRKARAYVRQSGTSYVYFVQGERGTPVKIGVARNVQQRLTELQTVNRARGEWFWPCRGMEALTGADLGASPRSPLTRHGRRPVLVADVPIVLALADAGRWMRAREIREVCDALPAEGAGGRLKRIANRGWIIKRLRRTPHEAWNEWAYWRVAAAEGLVKEAM